MSVLLPWGWAGAVGPPGRVMEVSPGRGEARMGSGIKQGGGVAEKVPPPLRNGIGYIPHIPYDLPRALGVAEKCRSSA